MDQARDGNKNMKDALLGQASGPSTAISLSISQTADLSPGAGEDTQPPTPHPSAAGSRRLCLPAFAALHSVTSVADTDKAMKQRGHVPVFS